MSVSIPTDRFSPLVTITRLLRPQASKLTPWIVALLLALVALAPAPSAQGTATLQPSDVIYEGFRNVRTNGDASTYGKALTHRYVGGELRFLTLSHDGKLMEFRVSDTAFGGTVTSTTATWQLPSGLTDDFTGIWYEQARERLWVTRTLDYGDAGTFYPTRISVMSLGSGGVSNVKTFSLQGVPSKQVFGGAQALPAWAQAELGCTGKPYLLGWGGYTSLLAQTSPASVGPAMFCIPDPDSLSNGTTIPSSGFKTLLNAVGNRGYRRTAYTNQVDQPNDPWVGKNPDGSYYFTWHDSYYNTGMWIEGATKRGYVSIASLGTGTVRYANGGVQVDGTAFEMHIWNPTRLDDGLLTRPDSMTVLDLPRGNTRAWTDYGVGKVTGATYDATSGRMYLIGFPFGTDDYTGRLYSFVVNAGGPATTPGDTAAPDVAVSNPTSGATVGATATLEATASDNTGVTGVWFTVDGSTVGSEIKTAPYRMTWNTSGVSNGTRAIRAVARDAAGNVATSQAVNVTLNSTSVDTTAPTVSLTAPAAGATITGTVAVSASASDNVGVTSVQFTLNSVNLGSPDTTAPYSISWSTLGAANGQHELRAVARDGAGNVTTSASRTVTVNNTTPAPAPAPAPTTDNIRPDAIITSPGRYQRLTGTVAIRVNASDNVGVKSVTFTVDGRRIDPTDTQAPYEVSWDTTRIGNGYHTIRVTAADAAGNTRTTSVSVYVSNRATWFWRR
jgi:hypothetical protein